MNRIQFHFSFFFFNSLSLQINACIILAHIYILHVFLTVMLVILVQKPPLTKYDEEVLIFFFFMDFLLSFRYLKISCHFTRGKPQNFVGFFLINPIVHFNICMRRNLHLNIFLLRNLLIFLLPVFQYLSLLQKDFKPLEPQSKICFSKEQFPMVLKTTILDLHCTRGREQLQGKKRDFGVNKKLKKLKYKKNEKKRKIQAVHGQISHQRTLYRHFPNGNFKGVELQ